MSGGDGDMFVEGGWGHTHTPLCLPLLHVEGSMFAFISLLSPSEPDTQKAFSPGGWDRRHCLPATLPWEPGQARWRPRSVSPSPSLIKGIRNSALPPGGISCCHCLSCLLQDTRTITCLSIICLVPHTDTTVCTLHTPWHERLFVTLLHTSLLLNQ